MGLLDKFENVKVDPTTLISEEDKAFCERYTKQANEVLDQLKECWERNKPLYDNEGLGHVIERGYLSTATFDWSTPDTLNRHKYSYAQSILDIQGSVESLWSAYTSKIIEYFEKKYNITLDRSGRGMPNPNKEAKDVTLFDHASYTPVIEFIRKLTGGASLMELGINNFIERYQRQFKSFGKKCFVLEKHMIKVQSYIWQGDKFKVDADMIELQEALNFFETGNLDTRGSYSRDLTSLEYERHDWGEIPLPSLTKVTSVKFFKNRRTDFRFPTAQLAKEFYEFYRLGEIE